MQLTEDQIVALGDFCETLREAPDFQEIVSQFEQQIVGHMLATEPHELKKREGYYASLMGVREFLGHIAAIKNQRDQIITRNNAPSVSEDAPIPQEEFD